MMLSSCLAVFHCDCAYSVAKLYLILLPLKGKERELVFNDASCLAAPGSMPHGYEGYA